MSRLAGSLVLLGMLLASGCGGDKTGDPAVSASSGAVPSPATERRIRVAAGALDEGSAWTLAETEKGRLCLRLALPDDAGVWSCTELTARWVVGVAEPGKRGRVVVYAGLPCGVSSAALERGREVVHEAEVAWRDDVAYVVLQSTHPLDGLALVGRDRAGREVLRIDGLRDDPSSRVPTVAC